MYQFTFPDVNLARAAVEQLRPYYHVVDQARQGQASVQTLQQSQQNSSQLARPFNITPQVLPPAQPVLPVPPMTDAQPEPLRKEDAQYDSPESQGLVETQLSVGAGLSQIHPSQQPARSDSSVPTTEEATSNPQHVKKRKREAGSREQLGSDKETKVVTNLIDFDGGDELSSSSLRNDHPALNPYEGTPWGRLDQLSVSSP